MANAPKSQDSQDLPENGASMPLRRPRAPRRRKGSILVAVAGSMIALLLFASYAVDVGLMHLTRARADNATRAAAWAGYERLKTLNFRVQGNETAIDTTIRNYLKKNGAKDSEAAAATVTFDRRGQVKVTMSKESPIFFGHLAGMTTTAVAGQGKIVTNKLTPFAVPSTYQDPDQNGYTNWNISDETIDLTTNPWVWKPGNAYIIKFGRDSGQPGNNADWLFIPMDDDAHDITILGQPFRIPAVTNQTTSWTNYDNDNFTQRAQDSHKSKNGFLRAYGIAYDVAGVNDANVFWTLGYAGGGFLIEEEDLLAASGGSYYTIGSESSTGVNSFTVPINSAGTWTGVTALRLRSKSGPDYRAKDLAFLDRLDQLTNQGKINLLKIPKQPKILTFTGGADYVTRTMSAAGIPFRAVFFSNSSFHDFTISATDTVAQLTSALLDTGGANGGPFDWLHLHHENFGTGTSGNPYESLNLVGAIDAFVRVHHRFIFSACWASDSLEIALAKFGSPNWTDEGAVPELHVVDHGADASTQEIQYGKTFAFTDFYVSKGDVAGSSGVDGGPALGSEKIGRDSTECQDTCFDHSEIDNEYSNVNAMYLDYLNPLLQNHGGFGGYELIEETETVSTAYDANDHIDARSGKTDSFRYKGDGYVHCPPNLNPIDVAIDFSGNSVSEGRNDNGSYQGFLIEASYNTGGTTSHSYYTDPQDVSNSGRTQLWAREQYFSKDNAGSCDINGDGDSNDYVRVKDLAIYRCPCGSGTSGGGNFFATALGGGQYRMEDLNCDGDKDDYIGRNGPGNGDAMYDEDIELQLCATPHTHTLFKPHVFATGGFTTAQDISADPNRRVMILTRARDPNKDSYANFTYAKYLSGTGDDDNDLSNGFGRWSFLGGHSPSDLNGDSSANSTSGGITGRREYLNNILFGSTQGIQPGGAFTPGTGAVNPGGLGLGGTGGSFGATGGFTGSSFSALFRVGAQGLGVPVGAKFLTAPGNFATATGEGEDFMFLDEDGNRTSDTWNDVNPQILTWSLVDQLNHPQVVVVPVVERIPDTPAIVIPTPEVQLDDWLMPTSSPAQSANSLRNLSMYAGDISLGEDDPGQARALHVIGFYKFFIVDQQNQAPDTQDPTTGVSYVAETWRDAEIRGYYLGPYTEYAAGLRYPAGADDPDPR